MKNILTCVCAGALALGLSASMPAAGSPLPIPTTMPAVSGERTVADLHRVQSGPQHHYWRGHRGYRHHHPGYRYHGGFWFPPAAFIAGAIIGGALAAPPPYYHHHHHRTYHYSPAHVEWCYGRYRSYRASDNSLQPYHGPRRQCRSPYM